jgi:hypothetical protein
VRRGAQGERLKRDWSIIRRLYVALLILAGDISNAPLSESLCAQVKLTENEQSMSGQRSFVEP